MNSDETQTPEQNYNPENTSPDSGEENLQPLPPLTSERVSAVPEKPETEAETPDPTTSPQEDPDPSEPSAQETPPVDSPTSQPDEGNLDLDAIYEQATETPSEPSDKAVKASDLEQEVSDLEQRKSKLEGEVAALEAKKQAYLSQETADVQAVLKKMVQESLQELEQQRQTLQITVDKLERRRDRIREEIRSSFAGTSQDIAIRVKGFKDYLVGSLQDLAATAEQLELPNTQPPQTPPPRPQPREDYPTQRPRSQRPPRERPPERFSNEPRTAYDESPAPRYGRDTFQEQRRQISQILDQYRTMPDYYGPPWQLRRTFEPVHADRVQDWFFKKGGRGAVRSLGSRLQNILVASAAISILRRLHDEQLHVLVLANTPERLGEWRRGLQDCLGISRSDFGPSRGIGLFESPEALVQKAERLMDKDQLPFIVMDETEDMVNLSLLQFPLWIAFAPDANQMSSYVF